MAEVKVLVEGYTTEDSGKENSCSTVTLVKDKKINMIVDPGSLKNQKILLNKLKKENLSVNDINFVCITHSHMDHYKNIGMFPKAKALDYWGVWDGDKVDNWKYNQGHKFTKDIEVIKTPGHSYDSITLLVKTKTGIVVICGDVFWKEDFPKKDPYASDGEKLKESREIILKKADYIIPGHGKMFKVL